MKLLKEFGCRSDSTLVGVRPVPEDEAQIDERGRKIATSVRTFESIDGMLVVYCKIEKMAAAAISMFSGLYVKKFPHTWYNQGLAPHDEDDLHWPKLPQPKLPPLPHGEP